MGLFDNLKMATGLGLDPQETYRRAFEKGVLLGVSRFDEAATMFKEAAEKLRGVDAALSQRASANACVYGFLSTRDPRMAAEAVRVLRAIDKVEVPGTADEVMEGSRLASELEARMLEAQAEKTRGREGARVLRRAAQAWLALRRERPVTFALTGDDAHAEDGLTRFFYDAAVAESWEAESWEAEDPDEAAERYAVAALAFGRSGAGQMRQQVRERLRGIGLERPCWFCGRHARGLGSNLRSLPTVASSYFAKLGGDRGESYDPSGALYACAACATAIDRVAEARAEAVRKEVEERLKDLKSEMKRLESRVRSVESDSHTHSGGA
jgi:hypothetical protein